MVQIHDSSTVQLVSDVAADLGESPSWDAEADQLLSVDINGKTIHILCADFKTHKKIHLSEMVSAVSVMQCGP